MSQGKTTAVVENELFALTAGDWWPMSRKPLHWGLYEVRRRDGAGIERIHFGESGWEGGTTAQWDRWRGQVMLTVLAPQPVSMEEEAVRRAALSTYMGNDPATHAPAAHAAWWLARRAASLGDNKEAFRLYMVANRIAPRLLAEVDRTWQRRCRTWPQNAKNPEKFDLVEAQVEAFFAARGEADAHGSPAGNPKLVVEDLVVAESVHGTYFYHLARQNATAQSLCGARTMATSMELSQWGGRGHLNERYCTDCVQILPAGEASKLGSAS